MEINQSTCSSILAYKIHVPVTKTIPISLFSLHKYRKLYTQGLHSKDILLPHLSIPRTALLMTISMNSRTMLEQKQTQNLCNVCEQYNHLSYLGFKIRFPRSIAFWKQRHMEEIIFTRQWFLQMEKSLQKRWELWIN